MTNDDESKESSGAGNAIKGNQQSGFSYGLSALGATLVPAVGCAIMFFLWKFKGAAFVTGIVGDDIGGLIDVVIQFLLPIGAIGLMLLGIFSFLKYTVGGPPHNEE